MNSGTKPRGDGDVNLYEHPVAKKAAYWHSHRAVYFINGMNNSAEEHRASAIALSELQMCKVVGVFNKSSGTVKDLIQCLGDKVQWDSHGVDRSLSKASAMFHKAMGTPAKAERALIEALSRNPAAVSVFKELRTSSAATQVFAHSQGNLILSNALTAIDILEGNNALSRFTVHSYGSPTVNWPSGFTHHRHGFTFDPVNWLAGFDRTFSISKVGVPSVPEAAGVISHGFKSYLADDATFVVNRFRWGSFGMTVSMDEEGLATALANMGTNIPRVTAIFKRLYSAHNSDVDDVAVRYVGKIKNNSSVLNLVKKNSDLRDLLVKSMDEGWTSTAEKDAIGLLSDPG